MTKNVACTPRSGQTVEQVGGIFARAVVKRDGQQLRAAVLRLRGSGRQDQRGEQQQNQQQRYELMDRSHMGSPFCRHHSRIREKASIPRIFQKSAGYLKKLRQHRTIRQADSPKRADAIVRGCRITLP
ncbi:MAG: hypothetical protein ACLUFI_14790 [Oscillospiraceae bacterium]